MMTGHADPGALIARSTVLKGGVRVTLRLARSRDRVAIEQLVAREGGGLTALEIARLVHSSPRERVVLCANSLQGGREILVGFGAAMVAPDGATPALVVIDTERAPGLGPVLYEALLGRAESLARARAARGHAA